MVLLSQSIKENIFKYRFQGFLTSNKIKKSGNSTDVIERIQNLIENKHYKELFLKFLKEEFKYGKNKLNFYSHLSLTDVTIISDFTKVEHLLALSNIFTLSFNNLLKLDPENNDILYLNITTENNINKSIEMCIYKEIESNVVGEEKLNNYVWIEFNIQERYINIRLRPQLNMANRYTPKKLYEEVLDILRGLFKIVLKTKMGNGEETLYKMYKEYITTAELPYRERVNEVSDLIKTANIDVLSQLDISEESEIFSQIISRYKRLIERILIIEDLENYNTCHSDREAIVERISVADDSGATANVLSGDEDGLDVATIYFDIRETIDNLGRLKKIWIKWFFNGEPLDKQISMFPDDNEKTKFNFQSYCTKFECFPNYILITYMKEQYINGKVNEHVFSSFRKFEES